MMLEQQPQWKQQNEMPVATATVTWRASYSHSPDGWRTGAQVNWCKKSPEGLVRRWWWCISQASQNRQSGPGTRCMKQGMNRECHLTRHGWMKSSLSLSLGRGCCSCVCHVMKSSGPDCFPPDFFRTCPRAMKNVTSIRRRSFEYDEGWVGVVVAEK